MDNEARTIEKLRASPVPHENLVRIFRHGWMSSQTRGNSPLPVYYIDMELGQETLDEYIRRGYSSNDPPNPFDIWEIMLQIAAGIDYLHKRQMIHRDLKPANSIAFLCFVLI